MGDEALMAFVIIVLAIMGVTLWIKKTIKEAQEKQSKDETVSIYGLNNAAEATLLKGLLEDNDIPCIIHSFKEQAYLGPWQEQAGWGILKVLVQDQARAEELIHTYLEEQAEQETEDV